MASTPKHLENSRWRIQVYLGRTLVRLSARLVRPQRSRRDGLSNGGGSDDPREDAE